MQHAEDALGAGGTHNSVSVGVCVTRMYDHWAPGATCEVDLRLEGADLYVARRGIVVVVQTTLAQRHSASLDEPFESQDVGILVEGCGIVRMNAGGECDEARIRLRDPGRVTRLIDGCTDADYSRRARVTGALNYRVAVAGEGFVREVGVTVEEGFHTGALLARGNLCSIQMSTGPAT